MKSISQTILVVSLLGQALASSPFDSHISSVRLSSQITTLASRRRSSQHSSDSFVDTSTTSSTLSSFIFDDALTRVQLCSSAAVPSRSILGTLARGAFLRIASDLSGGTVLESIKTRTTLYPENPIQATRNIIKNDGILGLWTGTPSRTVEGALIGAVFMLGSTFTKAQVIKMGASPTVAALAGGLVGGVAQAFVMTPAGMIFTSLTYTRGKKGHEKDNAISVTKRVIAEKGISGMYSGFSPMAWRQATNWASRAGFTEIARSTLGLSKYGLVGELASGCLGGVGSCWNTPIETIRVVTQRDVSSGVPPKSMTEYWNDIKEREGYAGLFRGVTPRAVQAIWQTTFLVVVPNLMGI